MTVKFDLSSLRQAITGSAAALRCRTRLQPAGGEGDKVFPPTYAGAVYAIEKRRVPGKDEPVWCVCLDSVQSQANRMEARCVLVLEPTTPRVAMGMHDLKYGWRLLLKHPAFTLMAVDRLDWSRGGDQHDHRDGDR